MPMLTPMLIPAPTLTPTLTPTPTSTLTPTLTPTLRLLAYLCVVLLACSMAACEFYTAGTPTDAGGVDAHQEADAQDIDMDADFIDVAVAVDGHVNADAGTQPDAGIEQCGQVGGVCTATPNVICPSGTRPYGDDQSLDCPGHCCVPDPASTCSSNPDTNCSMSAECTGCWAPAADTALYCDGGRPCCEWTCGG